MRAAPVILGVAAMLQFCGALPAGALTPPLPTSAHTAWAQDGATPPPPPAPHPKRASADRRTFHARLLQAWSASHSRSPQAGATRSSQVAPGAVPKAVATPGSPADTSRHSQADAAISDTWTADEIKSTEVECDELLASIEAEAERRSPIREGSCGTPVALRVSRIGSRNAIAVEPPAIMNCKMVSRLFQWIETVAQPAAKASLGAAIVRISNASSYMCRNRYNDPAEKMSQHAYANAIDVSVFDLSDGRRIDVKTFWGSVVASRLAAESAALAPTKATLTTRSLTTGLERSRQGDTKKGATPERQAALPVINTPELRFLTELHTGACGIFSTVLGPETNRAHHDHMHLDLTPRRGSAYCQ